MDRTNAQIIAAANAALLVDGKLDAVGEYFAPDYVAHVTGRDLSGGHDVVKKVVGAYHRAFSEITVEVEVLVEAPSRIAWQRTLTARHTGAFHGFPATGLWITWRDMVVTEFREGRMVEDWVVTDLAEKLLLARKR
jgi:predicted ester cyclase